MGVNLIVCDIVTKEEGLCLCKTNQTIFVKFPAKDISNCVNICKKS